MTAPLFLVPAGTLDDAAVGTVVDVVGAEARHAGSAMRLHAGEHAYLADGVGTRALVQVLGVGKDTVRTRVVTVAVEPVPDPSFVLVQALAKGGRDEQAVESATELGVDVLVPWQAARSVVHWRGDRAERGRARWAAVAAAAAKQSRRFRVPQVAAPVGRDGVAALLADAALGLVLHEGAGMPLADVPLPQSGVVVLVVGPEGGIGTASWPPSTRRAGWRSGWAVRCCAPPAPDRPRWLCSARPVVGGDSGRRRVRGQASAALAAAMASSRLSSLAPLK